MSHPYGRNSPQTTRTKTGTGRELAATARGNRARTSWQPPLAPTTPTTPTRPDGTRPASQNRAHYVVHFAPNTPFLAHPAEVDCTLSTTPTIHRTTPPRNGGFYYHRAPMTACRRRVAPLWSQFPPDNKTKRGNSARAAYHPTHQRQRSRLRPAQRAPQRPDCGNHVPSPLARHPDTTRMRGIQNTYPGDTMYSSSTLVTVTFNTDCGAQYSRNPSAIPTRFVP